MVAVAFTGSIPNIAVVRNNAATPYDSSVRFTGDQTPFTYNIQSGTLPAGMTLNSTTGIISGTPTTHGKSAGLSVQATDTASATATSNTFAVTVGPYGVRFPDNTTYISASVVVTYINFVFQFSTSSTIFYFLSVTDQAGSGPMECRIGRTQAQIRTPFTVANSSIYSTLGSDTDIEVDLTYTGSVWVLKINNITVLSSAGLGTSLSLTAIGRSFYIGGGSTGVLLKRYTYGSPTVNQTMSWLYSDISTSAIKTSTGTSHNFVGVGPSAWTAYDDVPVPTVKPLKYWDGSAWVAKPLKYWNGSAWVAKPLKVVT